MMQLAGTVPLCTRALSPRTVLDWPCSGFYASWEKLVGSNIGKGGADSVQRLRFPFLSSGLSSAVFVFALVVLAGTMAFHLRPCLQYPGQRARPHQIKNCKATKAELVTTANCSGNIPTECFGYDDSPDVLRLDSLAWTTA